MRDFGRSGPQKIVQISRNSISDPSFQYIVHSKKYWNFQNIFNRNEIMRIWGVVTDKVTIFLIFLSFSVWRGSISQSECLCQTRQESFDVTKIWRGWRGSISQSECLCPTRQDKMPKRHNSTSTFDWNEKERKRKMKDIATRGAHKQQEMNSRRKFSFWNFKLLVTHTNTHTLNRLC